MKIKKNIFLIIILTLLGAFFHFYNLNWGAPFYFHPDERNIASAVTQLHYPSQMNPHFFAYGSLPIYTIYFTGLLAQFVNKSLTQTDPFILAIIISRFYSAFFATLLIPLLFLIGKKLHNQTTGFIAALLATTSVGFMQFAHFGTFEMWLTFFSVLLLWTCLQKPTEKTLILMGTILGILVATKISSLALVPVIFIALLFRAFPSSLKIKLSDVLSILNNLKNVLFVLIVASIIYYLTNPFVFLDTQSFINSMQYESTLALGTLPVFYTAEFFNTIPVAFQFIKIYPFLINPLITIIFIPAFVYLCWETIKTKKYSYVILNTFYVILFLSQAFLFVKWTRYMVPTLPFIFLITAITLTNIFNKFRKPFNQLTILIIFIFINFLFAFSYFTTAFVRSDTRIEAYTFSQKIITPNAPILSEVYDMGIVPFNRLYTNILLFNFYDLDNNSLDSTSQKLQELLTGSDYIILPSQRIIKPRLLEKNRFPQGNEFYQNLINGKLGFQKIYETPCDLFCKITYLGDPIFRFEQTANVFDRPTIFIFEKNRN